jgi:hypothetical protein
LSGVIEVIEPPCILRHRKLLDVRIAVQTDDWQSFQIPAEVIAHSCDPRAVDESEIIVRVGSEPCDQLGCGAFEKFQVRPERHRAVRRSHYRDGDHCEHTREAPGQQRPAAQTDAFGRCGSHSDTSRYMNDSLSK